MWKINVKHNFITVLEKKLLTKLIQVNHMYFNLKDIDIVACTK